MKKLFLFIATAFAIQFSKAQETLTKLSDTLSNADTVYITFTGAPSKIKAFQLDLTRLSGSISTSGIALLQGTVNGISWVDVNTDTLKLTNTALQTKIWTLTSNNYTSYRACIRIPAGTQTSRARLTYLRRRDE
ncbi:MAG TPA: hypothetical protein PKC39_14555 [Ferruginibacter sp.]|nr:hypothetical protein [Ferruginibacter sp.]HMP22177.1 hypothetical protein [Ferruginibacter sp.]